MNISNGTRGVTQCAFECQPHSYHGNLLSDFNGVGGGLKDSDNGRHQEVEIVIKASPTQLKGTQHLEGFHITS